MYSSGAEISLSLNGKPVGTAQVTDRFGTVTFPKVIWASGTLTATCSGVNTPSMTMTHTRNTSRTGTRIVLRVDAPSPLTGTGKALLANGQDTGLLAAMVDADGVLDQTASNQITFKVVSGPGKVVASHNGDVQNHEPNLGASHAAYHGLVRGVIRVTQDAASPSWARARRRHIDAEHAAGPTDVLDVSGQASTEIVVEASSPGLTSGQATIALSTDAASDGVLAVAAARCTSSE